MQSNLLFSFISKGKIVIYFLSLWVLLYCPGCGARKNEVYTRTFYDEEVQEQTDNSRDADGSEPETASDSEEKLICVFVCGAVVNEGVYYLPEGSRVIDAVNAAGGFSEDADPIYVNQAKYVGDEERVVIPTLEEAQELRSAEQNVSRGQNDSEAGTDDGLININTASRKELMEIPGIGESKADRIIAYRESHGGFGAVEEIKNVSGIGGAVYDGLKGYIKVE